MPTNPTTPPPTENKPRDLVIIVRAAIEQHKLFQRGDKIIVGVSGGADSLALLHCLRTLRAEFDCELHVAHLNHQLRGAQSQSDADSVAELAREWELPATVETRDVSAFAQQQRIAVEEAARRARYVFFAQVAQREKAKLIAVAHHRDDQVETILMHFLRGSGMAGLRGMRYRTQLSGDSFGVPHSPNMPLLHVVRPLLDATRAEIVAYVRTQHLAPCIDQTNFDSMLFRNRLRHEVLPYLEMFNPNLREVVYRTALSLSDDYDLIESAVQSEMNYITREDAQLGAIIFNRAAWSALHPSLQRATLRAAVQRLRGDLRDLGWITTEDARRIALEKDAGAEASLPGGLALIVSYGEFVITDAVRGIPMPDLPMMRVDTLALPEQGVVELPGTDWLVETRLTSERPTAPDRWTAVLDGSVCRGERLLRRRNPGDRFQPAGMHGHSRTLHDFMIDEKIQRIVRTLLPVLVVDGEIAWVCGLRVDERARATESTREFWCVTFCKKSGT